MDLFSWSPMDDAPRDGGAVIAKVPCGDLFLFIRWEGGRWMCGAIPIDPTGFVWRRPANLPAAA